MLSRSLALTWVCMLALALVVGVITWQAFGWFDGLVNVVIASLVWATLITGWVVLRRRLPGRDA